MTTTEIPFRSERAEKPFSLRAAQALFLVPLGVFQLTAATVFGLTLEVNGADYIVLAWALVMSASGAVTGVLLGRRDRRVLRLAVALVVAQVGFGLVKLTVYHESASFVFFAITACAAAALYASRRVFE